MNKIAATERVALEERLRSFYRPVADDLEKSEQILREELRSNVDFVRELTSRVQLYQGKRLRPALLLLSASACGEIVPAHHVLAAVVEMIHVATLVHDDVLDGAERRRHVTTVNAEWGTEASVLLGDFLFTHSFHLAASLESTLACRQIGRATNIVCEGELHQIARRRDFNLSEEEYIDIVGGKTGELIACCCKLGAHFADATPQVESEMWHFGREMGIAFQIADDLLDLVSDEQHTGKSQGTDLGKQKATLPIIRFRETASATNVTKLRRLFDHPETVKPGEVLALLAESDALRYAEDQAREYADKALSRLEILANSPAKEILSAMTRFVVERSA